MKDVAVSDGTFVKSPELSVAIDEAAANMLKQPQKTLRIEKTSRHGRTLRPGKETPLWNAMRKDLRVLTAKHGEQAKLARLLGLDRQQINAFLKSGSRMPDAERTLQLLAWMYARQPGEAA